MELEGYTAVKMEAFRHNSIWISFNPEKDGYSIFIPKTCMKHMRNPPYVQLLVNPEEKQLLLRPLWRKKDGRRCGVRTAVTLITGANGSVIKPYGLLYEKLARLAGWEDNPGARYRVYGRAVETDGSPFLIFYLGETVFQVPMETTVSDCIVSGEEK